MSENSDFQFREEFKIFENVAKDQPITAAKLPCNQHKNRYNDLELPYDHSRFVLQPLNNETKSCSDYINANYVPVNNPL